METGKNPEGWDARDWAFAFGKLLPWIEHPGELEEFLREHPCSDAWWCEREFDRVVATGVWEAPVGYAYPSDEIESMLAALDPPHGTLTSSVKRSLLLYTSNPCAKPRYLAASLGDALDEFDCAAGTDGEWTPEGMRYHMEMLVSGLECVAESLQDAVRICRMRSVDRYWAFGREFDRGVFENLSDLIGEEDTYIDEVLALGDALEPPTGSDTWALLLTRLEEMTPPGTSWKDLAKAHPWLVDAHWTSTKEDQARLWYNAYCWCERLVMQVERRTPPCESLEVFFRDNPADGYWELGEPFDLLVTAVLMWEYVYTTPEGSSIDERYEAAAIASLINVPEGSLAEAWLSDVEDAEATDNDLEPPAGFTSRVNDLLASECGYCGCDWCSLLGPQRVALMLVHTKMLKACRGVYRCQYIVEPHLGDSSIMAGADGWLGRAAEAGYSDDFKSILKYALANPPGRFWLLGRKDFDYRLDSLIFPMLGTTNTRKLKLAILILTVPVDSMTYSSIGDRIRILEDSVDEEGGGEVDIRVPTPGAFEGGCDCDSFVGDEVAGFANKNMIVDEASRGPLFDATVSGSSALPQHGISPRAAARAMGVPESSGEVSREVPAVSGSDQGPSRQPAQWEKALKALCAAVLVLAVAIVAFTAYARWHDQREREEHEAYMMSLERLDRGELEAAIAANAEINEAFIKAELADGDRVDALTEDMEVLSIDLEDGELISGWVNATCTVRGLESGAVYEVDLGLRDDGVVKHVFGYMAVDEQGTIGRNGDSVG